LAEHTSDLGIGALVSHLLGYVEIAQTYRSVWLDHCLRPGFLTFQAPEGARARQPMAGEILSFKRLTKGGQSGSASFLPVATLSWALSTEAQGSKRTKRASGNTCGFWKKISAHALRQTSPYPFPRPSCVVSNLAGTHWMPINGGLITADGHRLERHEIVSVALDSYSIQESGYLESRLENIVGDHGCPAVTRVMFEDR
jgi:hypothetical protein